MTKLLPVTPSSSRRQKKSRAIIDRDHSTRHPGLAIVIPVFKHSVLMIEAITCALYEVQACDGIVVIVNDGCPYPETHEVGLNFSTAYPDFIEYIRCPNGGLSAARNRGIRYALARFPSIETVYLLDADNRLSAGAMARALTTMKLEGVAWVYPNIDKFGLEWSGDFSARFSVLRLLFQNICEAGSLIHRCVFDAGIFFDETMRRGFEDWEFWLQCADAGYRGAPCADFGFQYRARRESMVRDSDRESASIIAYIRRKHKRLYSWKNILRLEHEEAPRFCIVDVAHRHYALTSIAGVNSRTGSMVEVDQLFWQNDLYPTHVHFPNFIVFIDQRVMRELLRLRLADGVLWQIEDALEHHAFVFVTLERTHGDVEFSVESADRLADSSRTGLHIVAVQRRLFLECALDPFTSWIDSITTPHPAPSVRLFTLSAPFSDGLLDQAEARSAVPTLFALLDLLRRSPHRRGVSQCWEWRPADAIACSSELFREVRAHMKALGPLARCADTGDNEIAFLLPIVSFGGVEQVGIQVAHQFRLAGWRTRLIVTERNEIKAFPRLLEAFDCVTFLNDTSYAGWAPSGLKYYGHEMQRWPIEGRHDRLYGLVAGCGAVVVLQANHAYEAMGWLRRQGIVTIASLHLIDRDQIGAPAGHPYFILGYEHAFDFITAPSQRLLDFCAASGVPQRKLVKLPNAPTFAVAPSVQRKRIESLRRTLSQSIRRKFRILSIGRLDRQKGVGRLAALAAATANQNNLVEWRFVGGQIIDDQRIDKSQLIIFEPPTYEKSKLVEHIMWADAIILLSHWEGSPLSILEAQSVGTIPISTNVGSVNEMIESGVSGILLPNLSQQAIINMAISEIRFLISNPRIHLKIAQNAIEVANKVNWRLSSSNLIKILCKEIETRDRTELKP